MYKKVFNNFSHKEGSQHIASIFALKGIEKIVKTTTINYVFEFGIGIGTIPFLLGNLGREIQYYGTEDNEFCIAAFENNLADIKGKFDFNHLNSFKDYTDDHKFDLIIIDGTFNDVEFINRIVHKDTVIFVEGDRLNQRNFIKQQFPKALISHSICLRKNELTSPFYSEVNNNFIGGYTVFRLNSDLSNKIQWLFEKIKTSLRYKLRKMI